MAAKANLKSRTLNEREKLMKRTNYGAHRLTGWAPIPFAASCEIPRISSGAACSHLLYTILSLCLGRSVKPNEPFCEVTQSTHVLVLAHLCYCDERTVQRELLAMAQRKIIRLEKGEFKGEYVIQPLFREWSLIPDYKPGPTLEPPVELNEEPETAQPATKQQPVIRLTDKPVPVRAGSNSRKIKVECGVSEIVFHSNIDIHCEAVVKEGSLQVNLIGQKWKGSALEARSNRINDLDSPSRHPRHSRADEVERLFDELLMRGSGGRSGRSLSGDVVCFQQACEALGDVDHDYLVKYVVNRAQREISSPKAAVGICRDAARDWLKAKDLPPAKRNPRNVTREDMDAIIAEERAREAKRRRA